MTSNEPTGRRPALDERLQAALGEAFVVERRLGQGGFGVVFGASDSRLGRAVAIKVLRPELAAPALRERFRREAESAARLRHPGIIPIHAIGEAGDLAWFVMPLVRGETLAARLQREGRLPVGEARRILVEVAEALRAAHGAGLIHRDIKPDNILLEGEEGRAILTDFGIAKALGRGPEAGDAELGLTETGMILGTPEYMSPEQAGGEPRLDRRSDLYALGVLGYQMLTGEPPFRGPTHLAVLKHQLTQGPPSVARRRPECPERLARAVDRCLRLEPAERWGSAQELIDALGPPGGPGSAASPGGSQAATLSSDPLVRFRRAAVAGLTLILVGIAVDLLLGRLMLFPLFLLVGAGVAATAYGALWTAGSGWRDFRRRRGTATPSRALHPAVAQARSDRALILRTLADLPQSERSAVAALPAQVDEQIRRIEELASQLEELDQNRPGRRPAGESGPPRRRELDQSLTEAGSSLARILLALERARRDGVTAVLAELDGGP
jgi:hypothetical protein